MFIFRGLCYNIPCLWKGCGYVLHDGGSLERDSVDPAVREQHRRFRQGLLGGALERADYEWAAAALGFLHPQWWPEHEDHRALENALLKTRTLASKKE